MREHGRDASPAQRSTSAALHRARQPCAPTSFSPLDRSPHIPRRTVKGATALVPTPVWSPGRRGRAPLAAAPVFSSPEGQTVHTPSRLLYIAAKVLPAPACVKGCGATVEGVNRLKRAIKSRPKRSVGSGEGRRVTTLLAPLTAQLARHGPARLRCPCARPPSRPAIAQPTHPCRVPGSVARRARVSASSANLGEGAPIRS